MDPSKEYGFIIDESMMIGSQKILLSLAVPAQKVDKTALTKMQTRIIGLSVSDRWNGDTISKILKENACKVGKAPRYVITDNDTKMNKALRLSGYTHIRDINHTMGMFFSRVYKEDKEFKSFLQEINQVKSRHIMKPTCYLLPPNQRSIARYLNLFPVINWAKRMIKSFSGLTLQEKKTFDFIHKYRLLIEELSLLLEFTNYILDLIRNRGISKKHIDQIQIESKKRLSSTHTRVSKFKNYLKEYLKQERDKITQGQCWNASSDIIESLFGSYKARKATNPLAGVTNYILILPLLTSFDSQKQELQLDLKEALENVYMKDLTHFKNQYIPQSMMIKRRKTLAA